MRLGAGAGIGGEREGKKKGDTTRGLIPSKAVVVWQLQMGGASTPHPAEEAADVVRSRVQRGRRLGKVDRPLLLAQGW